MKILTILLTLTLVLAACGAAPQAAATPAPATSSNTPLNSAATQDITTSTQTSQGAGLSSNVGELARIDEQGAVVVEAAPLNLASPGESLEFQIGLNTHSVDLSMDLASLATLNTDTGKTIQASQWEAPSGGHHVSGKLIFPASVDGQPLLEGAKKLTLTIKDLDVPQRVFTWDLSP